MSLNFTNSIDPRLQALSLSQNEMVYEIPQGVAFTNKVVQKASHVSNQSVSFNFNAPNKNTLIDRRFYCRIRFEVTFFVDNNETAPILPFPAETFCPRAFPLASISENINISINGTSISCKYSDVMMAYLRYASPEELFAYDLSGTPSQLDFYVNYDFYEPSRSGREPFVPLFKNTSRQLPRSAFNLISLNAGEIPAGSFGVPCTFVFEIVEPIMISPLLYASSKLESGLINVDNIAITINFNDLNRVATIKSLIDATATTNIVGVPELLIEYKNIHTIDETKIPKIVRYKYNDTNVYRTPFPYTIGIADGNTFYSATILCKPIELTVCPKKIYIYAPRIKSLGSTDAFFITDSFFPITAISLSYLNIGGQFSNYSQNDLYNMSRKNGYTGSFQEWSGLAMTYTLLGSTDSATIVSPDGLDGRIGLVGGPLCIDCTDLALPSNIASGTLVSSQLQVTVTVMNQDNVYTGADGEIVIVIVNDGIMELSENKMTTRIGYINQQDVLAVRSNGEITTQTFTSQLSGGMTAQGGNIIESKIQFDVENIKDISKKSKVINNSNKKNTKK